MSSRKRLTPHTLEYDEKTINEGREVNWTPFLMYFHPQNHRSPVVNTDAAGFRYSHRVDRTYSVAEHAGIDSVRLLAGSSTVFGIGATTDRWTLPSRLTVHDSRPAPWLNFGTLQFNSAQELLLMTLYRHLLPKVEEIVLFTGFSNLVLARLPKDERHVHGAFFNCNRYFDMVRAAEAENGGLRALLGGLTQKAAPEIKPSLEEQLSIASELTLRHLDGWRALANHLGARLTFVLQPVALWVRQRGCKEEEELFAEFNQQGNFLDLYGDILTRSTGLEYAARLKHGADRLDVNFINFSPFLAEVAQPDEWLFVDRVHFTDHGHDVVARLLLNLL